ncbi:MAG TPA: hypothetical protein VGY50_17185, partial [Streptosporangiaceae bacterium]|nr:hypothetical protein [Streptosporangiaceae bacterium]
MTHGPPSVPGPAAAPGPAVTLGRFAEPAQAAKGPPGEAPAVPVSATAPIPATWQATPRLRRLAAVAVAVVLAAVLTRHASLLLLGAPALAAL